MHGSTVARALVGIDRPGSDAAEQAPTLPVPAAAQPEHTETTAANAGAGPATQEPAPAPVASPAGSAAIGTGSYRCRYAGAMMLFPYLDLVGAQGIFGLLAVSCGRSS